MSVTIFIRGKHGIRKVQPGKRWFLAPVIVAAAVSGFVASGWQDSGVERELKHQQVVAAQNVAQREQLESLKVHTQAQLSLLAARMGRMQARMNRIESVGIAMAERAELAEQFDFDSEVGIGGVNASTTDDIELSLLLEQMEQLALRLERADDQLPLLESLERHHHIDNDSYLSGRPLKKGWQSSIFGFRNDPFTGRRAMHKGVDFAGPEGGDVIATGAGVVSYSGEQHGYGNLVEINHGNGLKTRYAHNFENLVEAGQVVAKGDVIAKIGNTGRSTGPHVHYEVLKNDKQVNPDRYIYRKPRT